MGVPLSLWMQRLALLCPPQSLEICMTRGVRLRLGSFAGTWVPLHAKSLDFYRHHLASKCLGGCVT
jgi:hypothetical protein